VRGIKTGSVTTYWKLAAFFRYAAAQPEPMIGRGDDDVFISPRMLLAHVSALLRLPPPAYVYGGVFEWYSWRTQTLHSTGFGLSAGAARTRARKAWRNCTPADRAPHHALRDLPPVPDTCVGPIAFAKGPLILLSSSAVRWLVASDVFARDLAKAKAMSSGRAAAFDGPGTGRIDDDVQLGYWMAQLPDLHIVTFRRYLAWHDRWKAGVTQSLPRLLQAHKVPWSEFGTLCNHTHQLWAAASTASLRLNCEGPPCESCGHVQGQHACVADVELELGPGYRPPTSCWPKCYFKKGSEPQMPNHCWAPPPAE